jgi:phosphoserine/homoserine phosphotransferase
MFIVCLDLEGISTPEIWEAVAKKTGIDELKLTTRDISDYDVLMKRRIKILKEHNITLHDIQEVIAEMDLLPGAKEFSDWLRSCVPVLFLSDTFIEFSMYFMKKLGYPPLLCHNLEVDENGIIQDYNIRIENHKAKTVKALKQLNYKVIAVGDSFNDTEMLKEANCGVLFDPPPKITKKFPHFPTVFDYDELKKFISMHCGLV